MRVPSFEDPKEIWAVWIVWLVQNQIAVRHPFVLVFESAQDVFRRRVVLVQYVVFLLHFTIHSKRDSPPTRWDVIVQVWKKGHLKVFSASSTAPVHLSFDDKLVRCAFNDSRWQTREWVVRKVDKQKCIIDARFITSQYSHLNRCKLSGICMKI